MVLIFLLDFGDGGTRSKRCIARPDRASVQPRGGQRKVFGGDSRRYLVLVERAAERCGTTPAA